jgi:hypothetical protein
VVQLEKGPYQGIASAMPEKNDPANGFSRWVSYGRSG